MDLDSGGDVTRSRRRNVQICKWIGFWSTVSVNMAAGQFLDVYIFLVSNSNRTVGAVESSRGIVQLLIAPVIGMLADRVDRYKLSRVQAVSRAVPMGLLALTIALDAHGWLYFVCPLLAISNHLGSTLRDALFADNVEPSERTREMSRNVSIRYLGLTVGAILQLLVLVAVNGHSGWTLPELRVALIAGCVVYLIAEPAAFFLQSLPPADALPPLTSAAAETDRSLAASKAASDKDSTVDDVTQQWKHERVCKFVRGGMKKMWAIPICVEVTLLVVLFVAGMSTKFFPLYFKSHFGLSPQWLCILGAIEPLGVAMLVRTNPVITRRLGRPRASLLFMIAAPILLMFMTISPWAFLAAILLVFRTSTARSPIPLYQSIVAACVPSEHRGKFAAMGGFRMSFFAASAFVGGWLADAYGSYRPAFFMTALFSIVSISCFLPVVAWFPERTEQT